MRYDHLSYALIVAFFLFRIFYIATTGYNLAPDEAYFWDWSRHPALSYYDMGPMVAWVIGFFTNILPVSEFSVRLGAPVLAALTATVIYFLAAEITSSHFLGFIVVFLFHITPIGTTGGVIMTYYSPQVFFMSLTAFFLWRLMRDGKGWWLYLAGLSLGLGFLSHHMFIFFTAEVGLFLLLSRDNIKWVKRKEPYIALLIELAAASPVLIWNLTHNFLMFRHATGLMERKKSYVTLLFEYIGGQAGSHTPLLFLAVVYALAVCGYRGIRQRDDRYLLLFCLSAPMIIFIAFIGMGGRVEANWPISGYVTGIIGAVYLLSEKYKNGSPAARRLIRGALIITISLCTFVSLIAYYPSVLDKAGINLPPRKDPANRLYGWQELGQEVSMTLSTMPEGSFVTTRGYGMAAELAFYVEGRPEVYEIPVKRRNSQYDLWNNFDAVKGRDAVFVDRSSMSKAIKVLFDRVEPGSHLIINSKNGIRKQFYIYKCYGYRGTVGELKNF